MGIYDEASRNDPSLRKEFAPEGWRVPNETDWLVFQDYLIENGYNNESSSLNYMESNGFYVSRSGNNFSKQISSKSGWEFSTVSQTPGNNQFMNNRSGFNIQPVGYRTSNGFWGVGTKSGFWSINTDGEHQPRSKRYISYDRSDFYYDSNNTPFCKVEILKTYKHLLRKEKGIYLFYNKKTLEFEDHIEHLSNLYKQKI